MTATQQAPTDPYFSEEFTSVPVAVIDRMRDEDPVHDDSLFTVEPERHARMRSLASEPLSLIHI